MTGLAPALALRVRQTVKILGCRYHRTPTLISALYRLLQLDVGRLAKLGVSLLL
jgi:hypothetical protein